LRTCTRWQRLVSPAASNLAPAASSSLSLTRPLQGKIRSLEQIYLFSLPIKEYQSASPLTLLGTKPLFGRL
jgi:hypothetical protein